MLKTDPPIIVEESFPSSLKNVWDAITDPSQMRKWFFPMIEDFKAEVGFKTEFSLENEGRKFSHLWEVTEVVLEQKIKYNWSYLEYPGDSYVVFELNQENEIVRLIVTSVVLENFPQDIPEFKRQSGIDGWNYLIKQNLKNYLEKGT